jgi:hypothetical protein
MLASCLTYCSMFAAVSCRVLVRELRLLEERLHAQPRIRQAARRSKANHGTQRLIVPIGFAEGLCLDWDLCFCAYIFYL